jgi:hypothetical protein
MAGMGARECILQFLLIAIPLAVLSLINVRGRR